MSRLSQVGNKKLSDRISLFEKSSPSSSSPTSISSPSSPRPVVARTLSGKNFTALKSQFDSSEKKTEVVVEESPSPQPTTPVAKKVAPTLSTPSAKKAPTPILKKTTSSPPPPLPSTSPPPPIHSILKKTTPPLSSVSPVSSKSLSANIDNAVVTPQAGVKGSPFRQPVTRNAVKKVPTPKSSPPSNTSKTPKNEVKNNKPLTSKSQTAPIHNVNTMTINVKKTSRSEVRSNSPNAITLTKVIREKSSTAPITPPPPMVKVEPATPRSSVDESVKKDKENVWIQANNEVNKKSNGEHHHHQQAMKLELDYSEKRVVSSSKVVVDHDDVDSSGGDSSMEDNTALKRQRKNLELKIREQEDELDDLASQVQLLEQSKAKMESEIAAMKKEHRREISSKEDELEDAKAAGIKKLKSLEQQLEAEHEERLQLNREKKDLEAKMMTLKDLSTRGADEDVVIKLRKDLKKTKALLKDSQQMIERSKVDSSNKVVVRQLRNQLEDAEYARTVAIKAKQNADLELSDVQTQLDDVLRSKADAEDKLYILSREKADLSTQLENNEEELQETMKKYKASVSQLSVDQITISEQSNHISELQEERNRLKENLAEYMQKVQSLQTDNMSIAQVHRLELKIKELETKLDLEHATRARMENQIIRLKEGIEKLNRDLAQAQNKEMSSQELIRKLQRQLRDLKENYANLQQKETEVDSKRNELEKQLEVSEAEIVTAKNELKIALKRVEDLQTAINTEVDSDIDSFNSDVDSDSSEDDVSSTFLSRRRSSNLSPSFAPNRNRTQLDTFDEEDDEIEEENGQVDEEEVRMHTNRFSSEISSIWSATTSHKTSSHSVVAGLTAAHEESQA